MVNLILEHWILVTLILGQFVLVGLYWLWKRPERGLYLAFFSSGILLAPMLPVVREKLTLTEVVVTLTWMAMLPHLIGPNQGLPLTKLQVRSLTLGGAFSLWVLFSFVVNSIGHPELLQASAVETANFIYGYLMFMTVVWMVRDWDRWRNCLNGWLWGAVMVSFFGVWAMLGHAPEWTYEEFTGRVSSTLRNENQVPSFLLPLFVPLVFMTVQRGRSWRDRTALTLLLGGVFLTAIGTGSRVSLLMLVIATLAIVQVAGSELRWGVINGLHLAKVGAMVLSGFVVYALLALVNYEGDYKLGHTPAWQRPAVMIFDWVSGARSLDETRPEQLEFVWDNVLDNILIGTGPKVYGRLYGVAEIHNTYAGVLLQVGAIGFILFVSWLFHAVLTGWKAARRNRDAEQRLMVLCMVVGMVLLLVYSFFFFGLRQRNLWLLAGLLVAADGLILRQAGPGTDDRSDIGPVGGRT